MWEGFCFSRKFILGYKLWNDVIKSGIKFVLSVCKNLSDICFFLGFSSVWIFFCFLLNFFIILFICFKKIFLYWFNWMECFCWLNSGVFIFFLKWVIEWLSVGCVINSFFVVCVICCVCVSVWKYLNCCYFILYYFFIKWFY